MNLILENVKKSFQDKEVLKNISFTFEKGKIYGLLGRNGAGKTTLFNCISEEIQKDGGNIYLSENGSKNIISSSDIGYVFSQPILPEFLTGYEFLKFFIEINEKSIKNPLSIDEYLNLVKFDKKDSYKLIKDYSHGMKNKIQMLCYLIIKPPVLLLDEPLTSFDIVVATEDANAFIHFLYNVPILKKILPNNLYENTDTKLILAFVKMFLNIFLSLFKKSLYIGVFIIIPCILISNFLGLKEFDSNIALQSFIFLNFILGSFLNNVVFNTVIEENYIMIKLMRMDSRTYYLSQILFKIIIEFIFFIPSLLFLRIGFFNVLLFLLELSAFRFIIFNLFYNSL